MFDNWDTEKKLIEKIQKCQRNYDYSKWDSSVALYQEIKDYLLWIAENSPSKQHEGYYDVYWTMDREVIQEISRYTWGYTHRRNPPSNWRNAQANASLYILWVGKEPNSQLNCNIDGTVKANTMMDRWQNAYTSIGISIGLTMRAAAEMGFATGCNKSHNDINGDKFWEKKLGILDDVKAGKKKITYGIGIGYPKKGVERWESDQTEIALGAGNGSNLATDETLDKNEDGKPFRKIKIVDITKHGGEQMQDLYGEWHVVPEKADIKINTMRVRHVKVKEIK